MLVVITLLAYSNAMHDKLVLDDKKFVGTESIVELEDAETGRDLLIDTNDQLFCRQYQEIRRKEEEELQRLFRSMDLDSVSLSTHVSYTEPLLAFFRRREKRL